MTTDSRPFLVPKDQFLSLDLLDRSGASGAFSGADKNSRTYSCFWARNAIYHSLKALEIQPGDHVLVPSYICLAAVDPIIAYGAVVDFYRITRACEPDFSDLESRIGPRTRAVLAVHYFGFPQKIKQFRRLCDRYGLSLIEDCAHVLRGEVDGLPMGAFGEASVFSWRKFLPLYDGAELVVNRSHKELNIDWSGESMLFTLKAAANLFDQFVGNGAPPVIRIPYDWAQSLRSMLRRQMNAVVDQSRALSVSSNSISFDVEMINFPMSRVSRWVMAHSNISSIIEKRRRNYLSLKERLSSVMGTVLLFPDLPEGVCPWVLPLFLDGMQDAHLLLRQRGIPAVTWGGVRHPSISKQDFRDADFLYDNLVFLPIHQNLQEKDLEVIVETVRGVREEACSLSIPGSETEFAGLRRV